MRGGVFCLNTHWLRRGGHRFSVILPLPLRVDWEV